VVMRVRVVVLGLKESMRVISWELVREQRRHQQPRSDDNDDGNTLKLAKAAHVLSIIQCAERLGNWNEEAQVAVAISAFRSGPVRLFGSISNNRNCDRFIFLRYSPEPGPDHLTPVTSSLTNLLNRFKPIFMLTSSSLVFTDHHRFYSLYTIYYTSHVTI
jgi:hypothetical protein